MVRGSVKWHLDDKPIMCHMKCTYIDFGMSTVAEKCHFLIFAKNNLRAIRRTKNHFLQSDYIYF